MDGMIAILIGRNVSAIYNVERADGQLPTIPRWNTAKMPLTSGLARAVRRLRTDLAHQLKTNDQRAVDLGHDLANLDFAFKNIGKLLDEWHDRMQSA